MKLIPINLSMSKVSLPYKQIKIFKIKEL